MTQDEADSLKPCNGMGDIGNRTWLPMRKDGFRYFAPNGLRIAPPFAWRSLTHPEIVAEMNSRDEVPVSHLGAFGVSVTEQTLDS